MSPPSHDDRPPGAHDTAQAEGVPGVQPEDVSAYLDGELADAELAAFEAELEQNAALRADLDEIREVAEWLATDGPTEAPMGFANQVLARIEAENPPQVAWWAWLRRPFGLPIEGIAVALSAALVLLLVLPQTAPEVDLASEGPRIESEWSPPRDAEERSARQAPIEPVTVPPAAPTEPLAEVSTKKTNAMRDKPVRRRLAAPSSDNAAVAKQAPGVLGAGDYGTGDYGTLEPPSEPVGTADVGEAKVQSTTAYEVPSPSDGGTPTPEAPYVRPTEATTAAEAVEQARLLPVRLTSRDDAMLSRVLKLAARFGGARDVYGREITNPSMGSGMRQVFVRVRQDQLLDFETQLRGLGYEMADVKAAPLLAGNEVTVALTLVLEPSSVPKAADVEHATESP